MDIEKKFSFDLYSWLTCCIIHVMGEKIITKTIPNSWLSSFESNKISNVSYWVRVFYFERESRYEINYKNKTITFDSRLHWHPYVPIIPISGKSFIWSIFWVITIKMFWFTSSFITIFFKFKNQKTISKNV